MNYRYFDHFPTVFDKKLPKLWEKDQSAAQSNLGRTPLLKITKLKIESRDGIIFLFAKKCLWVDAKNKRCPTKKISKIYDNIIGEKKRFQVWKYVRRKLKSHEYLKCFTCSCFCFSISNLKPVQKTTKKYVTQKIHLPKVHPLKYSD
jgi:hypothetical protein